MQHVTAQVLHSNRDTTHTLSREVRLNSILEDTCSEILKYGRITDPDGSVRYIPAFLDSGEPVEEPNFEYNREFTGMLEHFCVDIVDGHSDGLVELFLEPLDSHSNVTVLERRFCTEITQYCANEGVKM